jgi:hypothetical protein
MARPVKNEWIIYAAFLPALLTSGGIVATIVFAWPDHTYWHVSTERAVCVEAANDNYVQGLAKLGIAKVPGYGPPPDEVSPSAAIAAAELRARNAC